MAFNPPKDIILRLDDLESEAAFHSGQDHVTCEIRAKATGTPWYKKVFPIGTKLDDALIATVGELDKVSRPKRPEEQLAEANAATAENTLLKAENAALAKRLDELTKGAALRAEVLAESADAVKSAEVATATTKKRGVGFKPNVEAGNDTTTDD